MSRRFACTTCRRINWSPGPCGGNILETITLLTGMGPPQFVSLSPVASARKRRWRCRNDPKPEKRTSKESSLCINLRFCAVMTYGSHVSLLSRLESCSLLRGLSRGMGEEHDNGFQAFRGQHVYLAEPIIDSLTRLARLASEMGSFVHRIVFTDRHRANSRQMDVRKTCFLGP